MWHLIVSVPDHCLSFYFLLCTAVKTILIYITERSTFPYRSCVNCHICTLVFLMTIRMYHINPNIIITVIRIFNGCEVLIENSVTKVTVRHHKSCRVMPNCYPSDGIFNLHRRTIMDFFFLNTLPSTIAFRFEYVLFYQVYAKITRFFDQEKFSTVPFLYIDVETFGGN